MCKAINQGYSQLILYKMITVIQGLFIISVHLHHKDTAQDYVG